MKKKVEYVRPENRLAQIVDYDINTADCMVAFRPMFQEIKGLKAFVWLSYEQEIAVYEWWAEHGNGEPLVNQTFSLRKGDPPEELRFWPTAELEEGSYVSESQGLMGLRHLPAVDRLAIRPKPRHTFIWEPIETCPKLKLVWLVCPQTKHACLGMMNSEGYWTYPAGESVFFEPFGLPAGDPTHWKPLERPEVPVI